MFLKIFIFIILNLNLCYAGPKSSFKDGNFISIAPPVINKNYYLLEYGFIIEKNVREYPFNAYVNLSLFEDWLNRKDDLQAGALGFKAGVIMPLLKEIPLSFQFGGGFAKAVLHPNPVFGRSEQTVSKNNMLLVETGLKYKINDYFVGATYQFNTVKYFSRKIFISCGVNY